jgi:hypothetical protein
MNRAHIALIVPQQDYCAAFCHAKRLCSFLASAIPISLMNSNHERSIDRITEAARGLAQACPSLRLMSFCVFRHGVYAQYAPLTGCTKPLEPLDKPSDELDGRPIRFWLSAEETEVASQQFNDCSWTL